MGELLQVSQSIRIETNPGYCSFHMSNNRDLSQLDFFFHFVVTAEYDSNLIIFKCFHTFDHLADDSYTHDHEGGGTPDESKAEFPTDSIRYLCFLYDLYSRKR